MNRPLATALLVVAATLLMVAAVPAGAAEAWSYYCITDLETEEKICTTELTAADKEAEFVFYFAHRPEGTAPFVVVGAEEPLIDLVVQVDDKEAIAADVCEVGMCYFKEEKSKVLLGQFKKGRIAHVRIATRELEIRFNRPITLSGFSAALNGPQ